IAVSDALSSNAASRLESVVVEHREQVDVLKHGPVWGHASTSRRESPPWAITATLVRGRRLGIRRVSRVLLDAADEIERGVQRLIILWIRRGVGLRAGLLVALGLGVAAQRSLAARVGARPWRLGRLLRHFAVRGDAGGGGGGGGGGEKERRVGRRAAPSRGGGEWWVPPAPWPKEGGQKGFPRGFSGSAPATISEAEAEPPLISTMTGLFLVRSPPRALKRWVSSAVRPRVDTISPFSRNESETEIA